MAKKKTTKKKVADIPRSLTVHFTGPEVEEGKVSVNLFMKSVSALQHALYDIGDFAFQRKASVRGRKPEMLKKETELFLSQTQKGSYSATLELRQKDAILFPEFRDLAEEMLDNLKEILIGVGKQEPQRIKKIIRDEKYRSKLMRDLLPITPSPKENYAISVRFGKKKTEYRLSRPADEFLKSVGGESLVVAAREGFQEAIVHARCSVQYDREGNISRINHIHPEQIIDCTLFDELDTAPFEPNVIETKEEKFTLHNPLKCRVGRDDDGLIIIDCEELKIISYGDTRQKTEELFVSEFAFLWHEYAQAKDEELSKDAIELKKVLGRLVKKWEK